MRILPSWLRTMVAGTLPTDDQLADELTLIGIAVENIDRGSSELVYEMEITTNRVDAMNHYGIARECSALYDIELKPLAPKIQASGTESIPIIIDEPALCARWTGMVLRDVNIRPSTGEIAERFAALGQKPINNAADATNYTWIEMGHPTHAFDLDKLAGAKIIVRRARKGEKIKTLDGVERTLHEDDLVIADAEKAIAIAGVIGGEDTKVTESTRNILIEAAWFDPATVRATSKRHSIHTDASHRFERGADFNAAPLANRRVAELILQQAGGRIASPLLDNIARQIAIPTIELRLAQVRRILGKEIGEQEVRRILTRLGFSLHPLTNLRFEVSVPTWRLDVSREIDLIEEIARVHGFNRFENTLPAFAGGVVEQPTAANDSFLRSTLLALGYDEAISSSFVSREDAQRAASNANAVELENPLSEERAVMRTSLLPGMLDMLAYNLNRDQAEVRLFEMGNVFRASGANVSQDAQLCFGFTSANGAKQWPDSPFFQLKGDLESIVRRFDGEMDFVATRSPNFRMGRSAECTVAGKSIATLGEIADDAYGARKIKQPLYACVLDLTALYAIAPRIARYKALSRFPAVERDFSLVLPNDIMWQQVRRVIDALRIPELRSFELIEIFRGKSVPEGHYSALFRARMQAADRTLTQQELEASDIRIVAEMTRLGGKQRVS